MGSRDLGKSGERGEGIVNPEDVTAVLKAIAEALTPTAQAVWEIYLRQVYVSAAINLFWGVSCSAGVVLLAAKISAWWKRSRDHDMSDSEGWAAGGAFLGALLAFIAIICLNAAINGLANPEYHAIDMLLSGIAGCP
jgi:hypothetical protein